MKLTFLIKDINDAHSDFIGKVVIDQIAPIKEIRVKNYLQDWFDAEIETRDKLLVKFKKVKKEH